MDDQQFSVNYSKYHYVTRYPSEIISCKRWNLHYDGAATT